MIDFAIIEEQPLSFDVDDSPALTWDSDEYLKVRYSEFPRYEGETEFTPSSEEQIAYTEGTNVYSNIVINPIPSNWGRISWNGSVLTIS